MAAARPLPAMPKANSHHASYHSVSQRAGHSEHADVEADGSFVEMEDGPWASHDGSCDWLRWRLRSIAPALWLGSVLLLLALMTLLPAPIATRLSYDAFDEGTASTDDSADALITAEEANDQPQPDSSTLLPPAAATDDSTASGTASFGPNQSFPFHPITRLPTPHVFDWCYDCPARCPNILSAIAYHSSHIPHRDRLYKYKEIAASLPRFFRGCDHLYLQDVFNIARDSDWWALSSNHSRAVMLGDMHLFNFGSFDNNRGELVYDMNDFDQTFIADYHVDLWRTSTSIVIHMDVNGITSKTRPRRHTGPPTPPRTFGRCARSSTTTTSWTRTYSCPTAVGRSAMS